MTMPPTSPIAELLRKRADSRGHQIAFSAPGGRAVTYIELAERTANVAHHLAGIGVTRGSRVAIVLGNSIETVESTFGITRAAAVGVPLDPRSSKAELIRAFGNSHASVVITDRLRFDRVRDAIVKARLNQDMAIVVVGRDDADQEAAGGADGLVQYEYEDWAARNYTPSGDAGAAIDTLGSDEVAWLHYTSGSTGEPKGVKTSQRAWLWTAFASYVPALGLDSKDKLFWPLPLFHAFGQSLAIIGTVVCGASTHLLGDAPLIDELLCKPHPTIIAGAPAVFRQLVTDVEARHPLSLLRPRACISAGASPPSELSSQVEDLFGVPLINHYGCTECGLIATTSPGDPFCENSCGPPVSGIDVQIRRWADDGTSVQVADGEEGEITVRTPSFMLGYDGDSRPFKTADGWYRTGDLGFRHQSMPGSTQTPWLTVTGRLKELIIRGGENIHPGEVERAVRACPGVADVVVAGLPHDMLGEVPAAFIVPVSGADLDATMLLKACRTLLPDYKVPVTFYSIDAIPHTASGKPRRFAVVDILRSGSHCKPLAAHLLTRDLVEPLVLAETAAVCDRQGELKELDPDQPFMALGMNSLKSVVLRERLAALTGLDLHMTVMFDHPTPAALSQYLCDELFGIQGRVHDHPAVQQHQNENSATEDPVAIVSMDCRYPGGISSPEDLWHVLSEGIDTSSEFPTNRGWDVDALYDPDPAKMGHTISRRGGFIHDMADFDAAYFGMSPREALATDPQQRLLLETTHSLIERAGIAPSSLRGSSTGVFVGMIYSDYVSRFDHGNGNGNEYEAHLDIGASPSVAAGRLAYFFDLKGPALAIDAACSSSLTAIHLAAASLRSGESGSLAIAGGVTVMSTPRQFIAFSRQRGLSRDGRCRSYSSDANGTGWSEGVGLVLLERLSDARRNEHTVLGLVRGTAVNNDGMSAGLTVPSGPAQEEIIGKALDQAALSPTDVDMLDGHGTATELGDPIEMRAIVKAYGAKPRYAPLMLGSVKSNIGHTQAAAGIASVIKVLQSMQQGIAPASINITKPSPHVDWKSGTVELLTKARQWPQTPHDRPRRGAVSSFGINGTNAHIILEQYIDSKRNLQEQHEPTAKSLYSFPWLLSGADDAALRAKARQMAALCGDTDNALNIAYSLVTSRSALAHRAAVTGNTVDDLRGALLALAEGYPHSRIFTGVTRTTKAPNSRLVFAFSGQGSQRLGMGQQLSASFPQFDEAFRRTCKHLDPLLPQPLIEVINGQSDTQLLNRADFAQAGIFAFEVAMYRLLESLGIRPDYVVGHSLGEVAAAHVAGFLSLADAATLIAARGSLMAALPGNGKMVCISASEDEVNKVIQDMGIQATTVVAAINTQKSVVVSGPNDAVLKVKSLFAEQGRPVTQLRVSHAFHSPMMSPMLDDFRNKLETISWSQSSPKVPLVSTLTGKLVANASDMTVEHWLQHIIAPVRFADALETLSAFAKAPVFVEIGASCPLQNYIPDPIATSGKRGSEVDILLNSLGQLWTRGCLPDGTEGRNLWAAVFHGSGARLVGLPLYPFQRRTYWLEPADTRPVSSSHEVARISRPSQSSSQPATPPSLSAKPHVVRGTTPNALATAPNTPPATPDSHTRDPSPHQTSTPTYYPWQLQLGKVAPQQRQATLQSLVQAEVASILGYQDGEAASEAPITELGCDSVLAVMLRERLGKQSGLLLEPHWMFEPETGTIQALTEFFYARMQVVE